MTACISPTIDPVTDDEVAAALDLAVDLVRRNLPEFTHAARNHSSVDNFYPTCANDQWTCGFWPGQVWLAYERSRDEAFLDAARVQVRDFHHRVENRIAVDHHDMGFLYSPSCVAAYRLTGDRLARAAALLAADRLMDRFQPVGGFIQAWGAFGEPENYRFIIDCLMNLPLLYWATAETGDGSYADVARIHTATCLANSIRPDFSTYHTFFMDPVTGQPSHGATCQGYSDDSPWTRGQAWSIYGTALAYKVDRTEEKRQLFDRLLGFYLKKLPDDLVPYWDLMFTSGTEEPRDSSSASIVACGLLEMALHVDEAAAAGYRDLARRMVASLVQTYAVTDPAVSNGLVLHGTYSKKTPFNTCTPEGVDECVIWGDYFYMEALTRLSSDWVSYW
ncbi:glycoside hydrolase family 88 protein [Pleomorphomonas carboxyditropha]|uniref:Glucoronyl hydrolase n=1 Tax=Pleomorphomonas carboxyditropha TaxID=2023338 RepID=A0A2G9WR50_9HYPH|nr:glycoside hydrolase family 88 protein [Pleomorphomonas carboxyditropha]PIO96792.1 glucoronyl hydrolase [Pleomorphomonas carboxyditropha]